MKPFHRLCLTLARCLVLAAGLPVGLTASAHAAAPGTAGPGTAGLAGAETLDAETLEASRGGYAGVDGYLVRFGVDVATYANGKLVSQGTLGHGEISRDGVTITRPPTLEVVDQSQVRAVVVRNPDGSLINIIQNDLDRAVLQAVTDVSVDIYNPGSLRPTNTLSQTVAEYQHWLGLR